MPIQTQKLPEYVSSLSQARQAIAGKLFAHSWFKATDPKIQEEVLSLPDDHEGFLVDLASRPDEIGELDVLRLIKIGYGHFLLLPVFEVRSNITNQVFTYEYASWKTGSNPGARGIIFLETEGQISHFLVGIMHKFSSASEVYESIGGLYLHFFDNKPINFPKKIEQEICFHLGVDQLEFKKIVDLGRAHPDFGMTNNISDLFAAVIDISHLPKIKAKETFRTTHKPVGFDLKIIPIQELSEYAKKIEDNYFLATLARVLVHPEIKITL